MSASRPPTNSFDDGWPLDATARDALECLVRIIHRCGFSPVAIEQVLRQAVKALPTRKSAAPAQPEMPAAPHVLTVWHGDPRFVEADGTPRPLKRKGRGPSFEALVRSVDHGLDAAEVLEYLTRAGAVKERGGTLVAVKRLVILRGIAGPSDFRNLRGVQAMLKTAEHNAMPAEEAPGWLERMAENARFPVREIPAFERFLERETMGYLGRMDAFMRTAEVECRTGEPTIRLGVGMYRFEEPSPEEPAATSRSKRRAPRARK